MTATGEDAAASESPREHWVERWRQKLPEGSCRRKRYDQFFLPVAPAWEFTEGHKEVVRRLTPGDALDERSREILEEAQRIYASADARGESAERRATTLQGAVAIAASLLLAGGALLADPSKVHGDAWRAAFALGVVAVVFCLVMAGARALAATSRIHPFHRPTPTKITDRVELSPAEARLDLAAETLKDYGYNSQIASWKVAYLGAAAWWFRLALAALLVLAVILGAYGALGSPAPSGSRQHQHVGSGSSQSRVSRSHTRRRP